MENSRAEGREEQSRYQEQDEQSVCDEKEPTGFFQAQISQGSGLLCRMRAQR